MNDEIKKSGSEHYKTETLEPIDLIQAGGMLQDFAISNIIKYAFRNRREVSSINLGDVYKIKHYCDMLIELKKEQIIKG